MSREYWNVRIIESRKARLLTVLLMPSLAKQRWPVDKTSINLYIDTK